MKKEVDEQNENRELPTWAKLAVVGVRLGLSCLGIGLACLGLGGFYEDCKKKNEGN